MNVVSSAAPALTIVALHGNGGGGFRFERVKPYIPSEIRFEAITLPGFAGLPPDPSLRTLHDYAARIKAMIASESRPLILLGHGIGGSMALEFAQTYSTAVDSLILHAPVGARLRSRLFPKLMALPGARRLGKWLFAASITRPLFKKLLFSQPVPTDYLDRFFEEYRQCSVFGQMFEIITPAWFNSLQFIDVPTGLIWGEKERVLTVDQLNDYRTLLPRQIVRTVPDWDHFPMIEQPESYAQEIITLARQLIFETERFSQDASTRR